MADHSRSFGSSLPETTDIVGNFSSEVSDFSDDVSQRLTLDHYMDGVLTDGAANQDGRHRQVTMKELSANPGTLANTGTVFTKEVDSVTELHYKDDSGDVVQITSGGKLNYPDVIDELATIIDEVVVVTGTAGNASSTTTWKDQTIAYPSGFDLDNTIVLSSKIYNTDFTAYESIDGFNAYTITAGAAIWLEVAQITLRTTYYQNGQSYSIVLGKLI